jgi:hypothetical protein
MEIGQHYRVEVKIVIASAGAKGVQEHDYANAVKQLECVASIGLRCSNELANRARSKEEQIRMR